MTRPSSVSNAGRRDGQGVKDKPRQPLERKNVQPRVAGQRVPGQQLAFELEGGLFGREQDQRQAFRRSRQGGADFGQTAERLAAAGRTEEKARLHALLFAQSREIAKQFIVRFCQAEVGGCRYFLFPFGKVALLCLPIGEIPVG